MKRLFTIFTLLLLAHSCAKEMDISSSGDSSSGVVSFTASVMSTKATLINSWSGGEEVALFVDGDDVVYHFTVAEDGTMTGDDVIVDKEDVFTYTAFYPYDSSLTTIEEYEVAHTSGNVDYMNAEITTSGKAVELQFEHQMAALSFTIMVGNVVSDAAITLFLDGDIGNPTPLEVEQTVTNDITKLEANFFVTDGTDISSAMVKVEQSGSTTFLYLDRDDTNTLLAGEQYIFLYYIDYLFTGSGSESNPYIVYTADDLRKVGTGTDGWDLNSHYKLGYDIDLESVEFTAIGTPGHPFTGSFDGVNFDITGLYIDQPEVDYQGLFGVISSATIKDLSVYGSVEGCEYVGGIAGYLSSSTIENCHYSGSVEAQSDYVGGVAGYLLSSTIENCHYSGSVEGQSEYVGGIAGYLSSSTIENCHYSGSVEAQSDYVGGIAGQITTYSTVVNCYNSGSVEGQYKNVGGIAGQITSYSTVVNCYNSGSITGYINIGGIVGVMTSTSTTRNCYNLGYLFILNGGSTAGGVVGYASQSTLENCYNAGSIGSEVSAFYMGGVIGELTDLADSNTISDCYYDFYTYGGTAVGNTSTTDCVAFTTEVMQSEYFVNILNNWAYTHNSASPDVELCSWDAVVGGYPTLNFDAAPTYTEIRDEDIPDININTDDSDDSSIFEGSGTESDPYIISSGVMLRSLSTSVNSGTTYSGRYFKMTNNIDLDSSNEFISIGTNSTSFEGSFDGGGYEVSGLYINTTVAYQGLFGAIENATIKNLGVSGSVTSVSRFGGIVGSATNSTIESCFSNVVLLPSEGVQAENIGGIAGMLENSTVNNCYNRATITGHGAIGGIAGTVAESSITNCYNTAVITGNNMIGGIAGLLYDSTADNCYNIGLISTEGADLDNPMTGAIVGMACVDSYVVELTNSSYLTNTYSCAVGYEAGTVTITNVTALSNLDTTMIGGSFASTLGSAYAEDSKGINDGYPVLTWQNSNN